MGTLLQNVDFYGPSGDRAYSVYKSDGHKIRIGEGFPVEIGNEASSPMQVTEPPGLLANPKTLFSAPKIAWQPRVGELA